MIAFMSGLVSGAFLGIVLMGVINMGERDNLNHEIAWLENDVATLSVEAADLKCKSQAVNANDQAVTK